MKPSAAILRCQFFPHPGQRSPRRGLQRKQAAAGEVCVAELDESMTSPELCGGIGLNAQFGTLTDRRISARSCRPWPSPTFAHRSAASAEQLTSSCFHKLGWDRQAERRPVRTKSCEFSRGGGGNNVGLVVVSFASVSRASSSNSAALVSIWAFACDIGVSAAHLRRWSAQRRSSSDVVMERSRNEGNEGNDADVSRIRVNLASALVPSSGCF